MCNLGLQPSNDQEEGSVTSIGRFPSPSCEAQTIHVYARSDFRAIILLFVDSISVTNSARCSYAEFISVWLQSMKLISSLPVSVTGNSNDAVWFPVYSVLGCDDERNL